MKSRALYKRQKLFIKHDFDTKNQQKYANRHHFDYIYGDT